MFNGNSEGHKQYLLLSPFAQDIVEYDAYIFMEKPSRDGFINEIITKYMDKADASISIRLEEKRNQLLSLGNSRDESFIDIVEMLVNQYRDDLISKMDYGNGKRFPSVGINKENSARIYNNPDCSESDYYGDKPGVYIRAIIEEYTRLPFSERERVMLSSKINDIQAAINTKTMLKITLKNQKTYYVRPHSISLDEQHRYHYLVGMARAYESKALEQQKISEGLPLAEERIASFRISRIIKIREYKDKSGKITRLDEIQIKNRLSGSGVMYALEEAEVIQFRLTERGLDKYKARLNQRPRIKKLPGDNIYETLATNRQIHNYFFDFGDDIEIISPTYLRIQFYTRYSNALSNYLK